VADVRYLVRSKEAVPFLPSYAESYALVVAYVRVIEGFYSSII
jgi:hypothetical protein